MLMICPCSLTVKSYLTLVEKEFASTFPTNDLGPITHLLDIQVIQNRSNPYITTIL